MKSWVAVRGVIPAHFCEVASGVSSKVNTMRCPLKRWERPDLVKV